MAGKHYQRFSMATLYLEKNYLHSVCSQMSAHKWENSTWNVVVLCVVFRKVQVSLEHEEKKRKIRETTHFQRFPNVQVAYKRGLLIWSQLDFWKFCSEFCFQGRTEAFGRNYKFFLLRSTRKRTYNSLGSFFLGNVFLCHWGGLSAAMEYLMN